MINVDLCGAPRCIQAVLPDMRERGSGTIVNITSVAGRVAAVAQAPYVASKWALEGLSEQLAQELAPFGIRVAIIEPGVTKSSIFGKNVDTPNTTGAYDGHYRRMLQMYAAGLEPRHRRVRGGRGVPQAIETEAPRLRYTVSWGGRELVEGRARMSDEEWVALGLAPTSPATSRRFEDAFGLDIST